MLREKTEADDPRISLLEKIESQTSRASKIVNGLLNLAKPGRTDTAGPVDVGAVISEVAALLEHQLKTANIQLRCELPSVPAIVQGIEFKLQQVFLNLFLNAKDAMPVGGDLTATLRVENQQVVVEVADTGGGITSEELSRIYDPFFTTKAVGKGTGLGLSITYGVVKEHKGSIQCESEPGQGARFTVTLPCSPRSRERLRAHG
jgi:signal transduction histidine kinase